MLADIVGATKGRLLKLCKCESQDYLKQVSPGTFDRDSVSGAAFVYVDGADKSADIKTVVSNKETGCDVGDARDGYALAVNNWETRDGQLTLEWGDATTGCSEVFGRQQGVHQARIAQRVVLVCAPTLQQKRARQPVSYEQS